MSKNIKFFSDLDVKGELKVANLNASNLTVEVEGYNLKDKFDLIDSALTELEKDIDAISSATTNNSNKITTINNTLSSLSSRIDTIDTSINSINTNISDVNSKNTQIEELLNYQALQLEGLLNKDSELLSLIEALTTSVNNKSTVTFVYWD